VIALCLVGSAIAAIPTSFDARTKWTNCAFFILNQGSCGSCWDFCSVESFADRLCIMNEAPSGTIISPQPILDCSRDGCDGGNPSVAWNWIIANGDTTCTNECSKGCCPYDSGDASSHKCHSGTCDSGSKWPTTYKAASFKSLPRNAITTFQTELENNGPLQACFTVYNNFYTFFSLHPAGIYTETSGAVVGGHCVKMVGWGTSGGQDYWTFANSWDTTWGDKGYFKMARGTNLCGIEGSISEGFTQGQSAKLGIPKGIDSNVNTSYIVGGWHVQDDLTHEFLQEALNEALTLISVRVGRPITVQRLVTAKTQVVAGVNFHFNAITEGKILEVKVHRNLKNEFSLVEYQFN